jgi:hypothetical protein
MLAAASTLTNRQHYPPEQESAPLDFPFCLGHVYLGYELMEENRCHHALLQQHLANFRMDPNATRHFVLLIGKATPIAMAHIHHRFGH